MGKTLLLLILQWRKTLETNISKSDTKIKESPLAVTLVRLRKLGDLLFPALLLWGGIRAFELLTKTTILDYTLRYYVSLAIWVIVMLYCVNVLSSMRKSFLAGEGKKRVLVSWIGFGLVIAVSIYLFDGYRMIAIILSSLFGGFNQTQSLGVYSIFKHFPEHPFVPLIKLSGDLHTLDFSVRQIDQFLWSRPEITTMALGSTIAGLLLLFYPKGFRFGNVCFVIVHCIFYVLLAGIDIGLERPVKLPENIALHSIMICMFLWLGCNMYATFLRAAKTQGGVSKNRGLLPPHWLAMGLLLFLFLPLFADMHNQFQMATEHRKIVTEVSVNS